MSNKVCAVVVTYNRVELLNECIEAIKSQTYSCDILVINNHSTDETQAYLTNNRINHKTTEENIGGAGGFNLGMRLAVENNYDYIWVMDDDCIPNDDALEKLMDASEKLNNNYGFLASKVLWTDGSIHNMNKLKNNKKTKFSSIFSIKQATFVSLLVKKEIIMKYGLPIKEFFIWGDDIEFTRRIAVRNKEKSFYVESSIATHKTQTNIGSKIAYDNINNIEKYKYAYRNEKYLYYKEGLFGIIYYRLKVIYNFMRIIFLSNDNSRKRIDVLFVGLKEGKNLIKELA